MKKLTISVVLLFAGIVVSAQQDAQFTQNMFNKLSVTLAPLVIMVAYVLLY